MKVSSRWAEWRSEPQPHPMLTELAAINERFGDHLSSISDWEYKPALWRRQARETVQASIEVIRSYAGQITSDMLLQQENNFGGQDPSIVVIMRAMLGPNVITGQVYYNRMRGRWCGSDLPRELDDAITSPSELRFIKGFEEAYLSSTGNILMSALHDRGIRDLVIERHSH